VLLSSAGHVPPLVRRADGTIEAVSAAGMPLGIFDDPELSETTVELGAGDSLFCYTDGITEARRGREEFGLQRLREVVAKTVGLGAEQAAAAIEDEVEQFGDGTPADDTALLVLSVL
jgi:serine phosphatase RsbU (regulator of sigma subunit)